jgi:hypothetical protein
MALTATIHNWSGFKLRRNPSPADSGGSQAIPENTLAQEPMVRIDTDGGLTIEAGLLLGEHPLAAISGKYEGASWDELLARIGRNRQEDCVPE